MALYAEVGTILASSLEYEFTLQAVATALVPRLADWCVIDLTQEGELEPVASAHIEPLQAVLSLAMHRRHLSAGDSIQIGARSEPVLLNSFEQDRPSTGVDLGPTLWQEQGMVTSIALPLRARGRRIGVLTISCGPSARRYDAGDLKFLEDLTLRIAMAVENGRLYREAQAARDRLAAALETVADPFILLDNGWRYVYANAAAIALGETVAPGTPYDLSTRSIWDEFPHLAGTELQRGLERAKEQGRPERFDFLISQSNTWLEVTAYPSGDGLAVYMRDVSEQRAQEETIVQLSVPVLEIRERLLLVPLIGRVDERRAALVMDRVMRAVQSRRARAVVIDVTGLSAIDIPLAEALVKTARTAKLLGAQPIFTGLSTETTRRLVELGTDLGEILTMTDLRSGIEAAAGLLEHLPTRGQL